MTEEALESGDSIIATARRPEQLSNLVDKFVHKKGHRASPRRDQNEQVLQAINADHRKFGRIDIVINDAEYTSTIVMKDVNIQDFPRTSQRQLLRGRVRLQSSATDPSSAGPARRLGASGLSAHQSAKWAASGFSMVLAQEVAPFGFKITVLDPPWNQD